MKLSLQLYSVRREVEKYGLKEVLQTVKKSGFDAVEPAGYYDLGAAGLKKLLDEVGLSVTSAHIPYTDITEKTDSVIADMKTLGFTDVAIPWTGLDTLRDNMPEFAEKVSAAVKKFAANGIRLSYHNHAHEFEGADYLEKMTDEIDGLMLEPDIFWLAVAGRKPAEYVKRFKDKLMTIHLKELSKDGKEAPNPVLGGGVSQTAECIKFAREIGLDYVVLEFEGLDMPYGEYLTKCAQFIKGELNK